MATKRTARAGRAAHAEKRAAPAASKPAASKPARKHSRVSKQAKPVGQTPTNSPFIVAIGASAGGLAALEAFFDAAPAESGLAFIVVTHQHPTRASLLPSLLAKHTAMPVAVASDRTQLLADHVYLSPPGKNVAILAGHLQTMPFVAGESPHLPIDYCFRSLAHDQGERAICVVLSGTGTDGTLGLRAIKAAGGMAMVQDEPSAQYAGMPHSAAGTQLADRVLRPEQMPAQLLAYVHTAHKLSVPSEVLDEELAATLPKILMLLRNRTGQDFSGYKTNTIHRRLARRMKVHQLVNAAEYAAMLQSEPHELDLLLKELLITVTQFFRDGEAYAALGGALTRLIQAQSEECSLRIWVAGCSTGEEAYSIAMLAHEVAGAAGKRLQLQLFATDLDADAVQAARTGLYPDGIAPEVGAERLSRFFQAQDGGYRINKSIRDSIVFATQNILKDPPFTRLDLLSCRNLLIYLNHDLQQRVFPVLHYALKTGGLLWLGTSETASGFEDLFGVVDRRWKLYERLLSASRSVPRFDWRSRPSGDTKLPLETQHLPTSSGLAATIQRMLLERFAPPTVVVNSQGDIIYVHGATGDFLELSRGVPGHNLVSMARRGLELSLPAALRAAAGENREVVHRAVRMSTTKGTTLVNVRARRIDEPESVRGLFCVSFERVVSEPAEETKPSTKRRHLRGEQQLERELKDAQDSLRGTIDELQTSNEELKSSNEELQSTNEELQSTNEELETSKEELQSLNEELQTVNSELQANVDELARVNDDMQNLLNSTDIATLFLDRELKIKRFTDQARQIVRLIASDVGRPIGDLVSQLRYDALSADAQVVLETLHAHESEVQTLQGQWLLVRMRPYRTSQNIIDGVVITFIDIDRVKRAEALAASRAFAQSIVQTVREPLVVLDEALQIVSINRAFFQLFRLQQDQVEGCSLFAIGGGVLDLPRLRELLRTVSAEGTHFDDFAFEHDFPSLGRRRMLLNARRLESTGPSTGRILLALQEEASVASANQGS